MEQRWTVWDWLLFSCVFAGVVLLTLVRGQNPSATDRGSMAPTR